MIIGPARQTAQPAALWALRSRALDESEAARRDPDEREQCGRHVREEHERRIR